MRTHRMLVSAVVALAVLLVAGLAIRAQTAKAEEKEAVEATEVQLKPADVPAPVMATVKAQAPGASFVSATLDDEDGHKVYEVTVKTAEGRTIEMAVRPDGAFLESEEAMEAKSLPEAVAKTLAAVLPGGELKEVEKKIVVQYEIKKAVGEKGYELCLNPNGDVVDLEITQGQEEKD